MWRENFAAAGHEPSQGTNYRTVPPAQSRICSESCTLDLFDIPHRRRRPPDGRPDPDVKRKARCFNSALHPFP
jgi:hypothetical protein